MPVAVAKHFLSDVQLRDENKQRMFEFGLAHTSPIVLNFPVNVFVTINPEVLNKQGRSIYHTQVNV